MMKKNALWLWFVAVLAVNVLTACQKDDDDNTATAYGGRNGSERHL